MKNIIWLASYPKSGNTLIRLFLTCYLFSKDGILKDFNLIRNIILFNHFNIFNKIKNICDKDELVKNPEKISNYWIKAQEALYKNHPKEIFILKTHNANIVYNNNPFTNERYTKRFIYIVRDPRSVLISSKYHYNLDNYEIAMEHILSDKRLTYVNKNLLPEFLLSWRSHYLSWLNFSHANSNLGLIIKYEDLIENPEKMFLIILNFLKEKSNTEIDKKKFYNSLQSVQFNNLQNIEKTQGFEEKRGQAKFFFRKGLVDEWKTEVPENILKTIEKEFNQEMKDLGYL